MATTKKNKVAEENPRIAVLSTHTAENLYLRANPTEEEVRGFVKEHNRRYHAGEPGGPGGSPALLIIGASFYDADDDLEDPEVVGQEIDISGL